ncbi:Por secretion system C-terminal sorting domain-containing protein [Hymenobacter daecheongensis DSM 21074]|uniref:Por secretion system C-terminal sorting domain-containing protein n=1 Tax=Hymenobacter daecheongensis DSM 21074 TaxID=1121955 RepID=A0A1M6MMC4_9BACT|nr:type IX secretion system sortase PorU [Hymenobacter daecheongensis]SHJ84564.1 Por secretion system C-terminal sorting domain-containing protein [Hymenobacter daecheongensis DSM 21074]
MRYFTFFAFLCFVLGGAAVPAAAQQAGQVASGQLVWKGYAQALKANGQLRQVPTFYGGTIRPGEEAGRYVVRIAGSVADGQLRNAVYAPFSAADARLFDLANLAAAPSVILATGTEKRQPITLAAILSVRRNPQSGQPEKLISFEYAYTLAASGTAQRGTQSRSHAPASVLKQGDWFKIGVPQSGMYKLDKNALKALGVDVQGLDPRRLRLYGNAMGTLPQLNSTYRPDDLVENAVFVAGENDGSFDDSDYLLFYARGPHTWSADASRRLFQHTLNVYTDTAYYFVTVGSTPGRRIAPAPAPTAAPTAVISQYTYRDFYNRDLINLIKSGRQWLGEGFGSTSTAREFGFAIPNLVPGAALQVTSYTAASTAPNTFSRFTVAVNGTPIGTQTISGPDPINKYPEAANGDLSTFSYTVPANAPADIKVGLSFSGGPDPAAQGWLDYLEVNALRQLRMMGNQFEFRSFDNIAPRATSQFALAAPGTTVWDVTNPRRPRAQALDAAGNFAATTDTLREFVAFTGSSFATPVNFGRVGNQNLHALNLDGRLDMMVVTHPIFFQEAERLAAYRRRHDGLDVRVVTTTQVYNEFSSGGQDVTAIRDLMKLVYDRAPANKTVFLLLFGDASYDFKSDRTNNADQLPAWWKSRSPFNGDKINQNFVPTYQSRESFAPAFGRSNSNPVSAGPSYNSDDYFALLDDDEGFWSENGGGLTEFIDIGVGRLPVRTPRDQPGSTAQAALVVNKLIAYDQPAAYGKWRNRITFVADDGDYNYHVNTSTDPPADQLTQQHPEFNAHKVYLDLYPQLVAAGGQRSPDCNRAIDESIEQGSLIVQYSGHGGPKGWADEQILNNSSVLKLTNRDRLTFMLTATCDFSTYDNPEFDSAGEQVLTDIEGGAVGLLTTTRLAFTGGSYNDGIVRAFYEGMFTPVNNKVPRMGDIMLHTKNDRSITPIENRNFTLLGDPSMRLAYPEQEVTLDSINGKLITATHIDTLKALATVTMSGKVRSGGVLNSRFSGKAQLTIYEKPATVMTLGNEDPSIPVSVQENVIYAGQATVRNGQYRLRFVVPKDINYSLGLGKVSLYASDSVSRLDAHGARAVPVGGANSLAVLDTIAPNIRLFMDDTTFVFGGLTHTTTTLLARLKDQSGINTAGSGIGHEITATLDNDPRQLTVLNDFYTANVDSYQQGEVKYKFKDLTTGPHLLRLKAWDTFNNSAEKEIEFIAAKDEKLALQHVLNYPNPFSTTTTFHFDHNRANAGDELDVQVQIFTISGRLVRTLRTSATASNPHFKDLTWNGRDEFDDQLARGVYVYRVSVKSQQTGTMASKFEKLVILN